MLQCDAGGVAEDFAVDGQHGGGFDRAVEPDQQLRIMGEKKRFGLSVFFQADRVVDEEDGVGHLGKCFVVELGGAATDQVAGLVLVFVVESREGNFIRPGENGFDDWRVRQHRGRIIVAADGCSTDYLQWIDSIRIDVVVQCLPDVGP